MIKLERSGSTFQTTSSPRTVARCLHPFCLRQKSALAQGLCHEPREPGRIRRICPQLLNHDLCHSDLFLLSLSMSLQSRHPCFQSGDPVNELLVCCCCVKLTAAMVVSTTLPHERFRDGDAPLPQ